MIKAIIYSSHQGFSKQYAYEYAIKTGIPIYSLEEAEKLVDGTSVIFFSWIKNGQIFDIEKRFFQRLASRDNINMLPPRYLSENFRHLHLVNGPLTFFPIYKFVNGSLTNCIRLIIKRIPAFHIF